MDPLEDIFPLPALKKGTAAGKFQPKGRPALRKPTCSSGTSILPGKDKKQVVSPSTAMSDTTKSSENVNPKDDRLRDPNASPLVSLDSFGKVVPRISESTQLAVDHMGLMSTSSELVVQQEVGISDALPSDVVMPNQNVEDSFVFEEFNGEMDAGMDDDLISNILPQPLATSANIGDISQEVTTLLSERTTILPSRDINGTRDSDLPASNYPESIAASISDTAQPHIHSSFCEKETQDMAMDGRDAASVSGYSCIDKDRSETEEAETLPDVQTTGGSHERISASGIRRPEREDLLETELPSGVGKPTFCITNSEVEPGDLPRDLVMCETHLDQVSAPTSLPDDIFDYSSIRLEDCTFGNPTVHELTHSDTLISANTMDVSAVPGDLNHHHKETWAASDIRLMQDKSCMSNTTSEGNKSSRQLRKRPTPCQLVDASDDEVHSDCNNSAEAHTPSPSIGDELCDGDEYRTQNSSQKSTPRKSERPLAKKQKEERKKEDNKASEKSTGEPRKKFSHSTRRGKRCVDKVLLQTPEDEIDYRKLRIRDLILLAEHKERLTVKKAKPSKANSNNQSADKSTQGDASHKEGESFPSEQGKDSTNKASSTAEPAPLLFNYQSFMEKTPRTRWSKQDTELFYEGIRQFGTDLSMIKELFPKLTRQQIKLKFKKEERQNRLGLSEALASRAKDHSHFELVIERLQAAAQAGKESSRDVSASMRAEEEDGESSPETNEEAEKPAEKPEKDAEIGDEDAKGDTEVHDSSKSDDSDDDLFNCLSSYKSEF